MYYYYTLVVEGMALQGTQLQTRSIALFREMYSKEVVAKARAFGMKVNYEHEQHPDTIPLPATLTMELGQKLEAARAGAQVRLYSNYPFPWRASRPPPDAFETSALDAVQRDPSQPYYEFKEFEGRPSLRYVIADQMSQSCVDCHNQHPDSPKRDWHVGDVRGGLEFIRPLDNVGPIAVFEARTSLRNAFALFSTMLVAGVLGLWRMLQRGEKNRLSMAHSLQCNEQLLGEKTRLEADQKRAIRDLVAVNQAHQKLFAATTSNEVAQAITEILVSEFGAYFARVWLVRPADICSQCALAAHCPSKERCLHLVASSGHYTHIDGDHRRVPLGAFKIGLIAEGRGKTISNDVVNDERVHNREWAAENGLKSFAGFPLMQGDKVVGVMAMFSREFLPEHLLDSLDLLARLGASALGRISAADALTQAQKLESIGQLAAGIAHEINTPTQFISDNVRFLRDAQAPVFALLDSVYGRNGDATSDVPHPGSMEELRAALESLDYEFLRDEAPKAIEQSLEGLERVASIVGAMKEFAHPGEDEKTPTDINKAIRTTLAVCRNRWKYVAELDLDLLSSLPAVPCLPAQFNQVVLNLVCNAADALVEKYGSEKKGCIRIITRCVDSGVEVLIADNGPGVPESLRHRIFDPFFTTKQVGKGTGQGLAISRDIIVNKLGGNLNVEPTPGGGATFVIRLPLATSSTRSPIPLETQA